MKDSGKREVGGQGIFGYGSMNRWSSRPRPFKAFQGVPDGGVADLLGLKASTLLFRIKNEESISC